MNPNTGSYTGTKLTSQDIEERANRALENALNSLNIDKSKTLQQRKEELQKQLAELEKEIEKNSKKLKNKSKKLFYVQVTKSGWVFAVDEIDAKKYSSDILEEYTQTTSVTEFSEKKLEESGWDENCLVYHFDQKKVDITLGEVLRENY